MRDGHYRDLRGKLKTGDVVLMEGRGAEHGALVLATGSRWTRVGQLVVIPSWDAVLVLEAARPRNAVDVVSGLERRNARLAQLSERLAAHVGRLALRRLSKPLTATMEEVLQRFRREGRPHDDRSKALAKAVWGQAHGVDLSPLFSAECLAESWMLMGLLARAPVSADYVPRDFSADPRRPLPLRQGYELEEEVLLS